MTSPMEVAGIEIEAGKLAAVIVSPLSFSKTA